jgi:hypothetical protein
MNMIFGIFKVEVESRPPARVCRLGEWLRGMCAGGLAARAGIFLRPPFQGFSREFLPTFQRENLSNRIGSSNISWTATHNPQILKFREIMRIPPLNSTV